MSILITLGNINQFTFANSIVAANEKAKELFSSTLYRVEIFHSKESFDILQKIKFQKKDENEVWIDHIEKTDINEDNLIHRTIEITSTKKSVEQFVNNIENILSDSKGKIQNIILDLTNGTTLSKNLLSIAAYVLEIPHQYMIDVGCLFKQTENRGFLDSKILKKCYVAAPDSAHFDNIAYLSLSEILRFRKIIESDSKRYEDIAEETVDTAFFKGNLIESIRLKLEGDQRKDNTVYRIAASSISSSAEDLISHLVDRFASDSNARMLGQKLGVIRAQIEKKAPSTFDIEFFRKFNDFVLYLRNSSTHKGKFLTDLEKFKADLAVKMAFPFIEFYTDIVFKILSENYSVLKPTRITELNEPFPESGKKMYYGLDGDDTGNVLEELFFSSKSETHFKKISESIKNAIAQIRNKVKKKAGNDSIVFEAGDDLLFTGEFTFKENYNISTSGLTCSIGYGNSFQEVYLALKQAKTTPGKNTIVGAKLST